MVKTKSLPRVRINADGSRKQMLDVNDLHASTIAPFVNTNLDGDKFFGGFGATQLQTVDYWTLRARSAQLFNDNLYARGLIRRLVTNEINTGLTPEACPDESVLGFEEDSLNDWTEDVESRFAIYAKGPKLCDWKGVNSLGSIQRMARSEALVEGDVLVVMRQSQQTRLPRVQLISGSKVKTPFDNKATIREGHVIKHGVELDKVGRIVAFWVQQEDLSSKRLPAFGEKSGRKLAWLVYGTDKRMDELRGQPLLTLVLQSLKEIDRYRDSAQRKAVINSILAMFIKKGEDKMSSLPVTGGVVRKDQVTTTDLDGSSRNFDIASQIPGVVMEELQTGEEPVGFGSNGTDVNFGAFETSIVQAVAWANEVPPEILTLAFSNNYSASQAAINEFKIYLNKIWSEWGENFMTPIYVDWLISETLQQKISSPGLLESWRTPSRYDEFGAWTSVDWYGSIKPSTDMLKQVKASELLVDGAYSTRARESRITTGTKFNKNVKRIKRENEQLAEAMRPMLELQNEFNMSNTETPVAELSDNVVALKEFLEEKDG